MEDSKHVMEHLDVTNNSEKEEGGGDKNAKDDENKWVELFDEETHRPYWGIKLKVQHGKNQQLYQIMCLNQYIRLNVMQIQIKNILKRL